MGPQALVAANENLENVRFPKRVQVPFDLLSVGFSQRQRLDRTRSQPLDKFIVPILDERTRTYDNDPLGGGPAVRGDARLEECVDQSDGL
jgi:hypothetical protein